MTPPSLDFDRCYAAVSARDRRFDGQFIVAVRSTGIYCRPSCPARTPTPTNVDFLPTAAAAQQRGFRACRRCRPDAVPGSPAWDLRSDVAARAMRLIGDGVVDRDGVAGLARHLGYSARQLSRVLTEELGAGPLALARARRATTARTLIDNTTLSMSEIALAAGFSSIRQFNDTMRAVYGVAPTALRSTRRPTQHPTHGRIRLNLPVRQPFSVAWLHWFLSAHAIDGLEAVHHDGEVPVYTRALTLPHGPAAIALAVSDDHVAADIACTDLRDLSAAVQRIRRLLDLDADTESIDRALHADPVLAPLIDRCPGIRSPGAVDPFETLIRTMVGQQISLAAARTHGRRLVDALGEPLPVAADHIGPAPRLFPTPAAIAERGHQVLTGPRRRVDAIIGAARAVAEGTVDLHAGLTTAQIRAHVLALPGIGRWTADYLALRVLGDPDVLLDTDLILLRSAARLDIDLTDTAHWAPWRSYVSMHLWHDALRETEPILAAARP
ncbi:DNA-3-methyladenine glycosylase 2 family protein [Williamsia sp. CHRR-6]|nr:DNA-3-methyladenine glycosylase 2 family protein [Williamsia sp. CHRR-6]